MKIRGQAGIFHVTPKQELIDLINQAPDDVLIAPNNIGNIAMYKHDFGEAIFVGYIDIEKKEIVNIEPLKPEYDDETF